MSLILPVPKPRLLQVPAFVEPRGSLFFDGTASQQRVDGNFHYPSGTIGYPITMGCWYRDTSGATNDRNMLQIQDSSSANDYFRLSRQEAAGANGVMIASNWVSTFQTATASAGAATNTWAQAIGIVATNANRTAYMNGRFEVTDTGVSNSNVGTVDSISIGWEGDLTPGDSWAGNLCHVFIYKGIATAGQIALLQKFTPDVVFAHDLGNLFYAPLVKDLSVIGGFNSNTILTLKGATALPRFTSLAPNVKSKPVLNLGQSLIYEPAEEVQLLPDFRFRLPELLIPGKKPPVGNYTVDHTKDNILDFFPILETSGDRTRGIVTKTLAEPNTGSERIFPEEGMRTGGAGNDRWNLPVGYYNGLAEGASSITISLGFSFQSLGGLDANTLCAFVLDSTLTTGVVIGFNVTTNTLRVAGRSQAADADLNANSTRSISLKRRYRLDAILDFAKDEIRAYIDGEEWINETQLFGSSTYVGGTPTNSDGLLGGEASGRSSQAEIQYFIIQKNTPLPRGNNWQDPYRFLIPELPRAPLALVGEAGLTQDQDQFRFYNDDGVEAAATPIAAQNTNITQLGSTPAIIRMQVNNTGDAPSQQMVLQVKKTSEPDSAYQDVPVAP